ncbi:hypothetical protein ACP4OV_026325 [Aristida adscensionis]
MQVLGATAPIIGGGETSGGLRSLVRLVPVARRGEGAEEDGACGGGAPATGSESGGEEAAARRRGKEVSAARRSQSGAEGSSGEVEGEWRRGGASAVGSSFGDPVVAEVGGGGCKGEVEDFVVKQMEAGKSDVVLRNVVVESVRPTVDLGGAVVHGGGAEVKGGSAGKAKSLGFPVSTITGSAVLVEVLPKVVFLSVIKSLEISDPVFTTVGFPGAYQEHIEFYSDLPFARTPFERDVRVAGEICSTPEMAERSAIKKAFADLEYKHNVVVEDLSTVKIGKLEWGIRETAIGVCASGGVVSHMIEEWSRCLDILYKYRKPADKKIQFDSIRNDFTMEGYIYEQFRQLMESACAGQMSYIRSAGDELKVINNKYEKYKEQRRSRFSG